LALLGDAQLEPASESGMLSRLSIQAQKLPRQHQEAQAEQGQNDAGLNHDLDFRAGGTP
jgi:hypothetical protein